MNRLDYKLLKKKDDFIIIDDEKYQIVFTNAERERSFNRNTEEGINEINSLKKETHLDIIEISDYNVIYKLKFS